MKIQLLLLPGVGRINSDVPTGTTARDLVKQYNRQDAILNGKIVNLADPTLNYLKEGDELWLTTAIKGDK